MNLANYFVNPTVLYFAPLVALPILIHLLNRIRYRRVRWAAIDFLLATERRAVRRARLRQILLMLLRTLLLAAALLALAQPIFRGGLARFLGAGGQLAVLLDASASMSASDASGAAFNRAKEWAAEAIRSLPAGSRVTAGRYASRYDSPFAEPVADKAAVAAAVEDATITGGSSDIPRALREAAESLQQTGGGGTIWILTDLQAAGWRADDTGAWEETRRSLEKAGNPGILISNVAPAIRFNVSVESVSCSPAILAEGDTPRVTATLAAHGGGDVSTSVSVFLDGKRVDARTVGLKGPGRADVAFQLPAIGAGVHTAAVQVGADMLPADDHYDLILRTDERIPVLLVDAAPSDVPFAGASAFLALAIRPSGSELAGRSVLDPRTISPANLVSIALDNVPAVFLTGVRALPPAAAERLEHYVKAGGLLVIFPCEGFSPSAWNELTFTGVTFRGLIQAEKEEPIRVDWASPAHPATKHLAAEGVARVKIERMFKLKPVAAGNVLAATDRGDPFLVRAHVGKGKVCVFAVSAQVDFSDLPLNPAFLPLVHRLVRNHVVETRTPPAGEVFAELRFRVPPGAERVLTPGGLSLPFNRLPADPSRAVFDRTEKAGVYKLVFAGNPTAGEEASLPLVALNVPPEESGLDRIAPERIRELLPDVPLNFLGQGGRSGEMHAADAPTASTGFLMAGAALGFLLAEVILAWSLRRPRKNMRKNGGT